MDDNVVFIVGKRGYGKSTLCQSVLSQYTRIIIFDPMNEYHGRIVFRTMEAFFDFFSVERKEFSVVCRFHDTDADETMRQYEYAAMACKELGDVLLVLEECELFITSSDRKSYINYLISMGRHFGVNLLAIGRRPSEIPIKFRANFTTVAAFRITEERDLQTMRAYDFDIDLLRELPKFEYLIVGKDIFPNGKDCKVKRYAVDNPLLLRDTDNRGNSQEQGGVPPMQNPVSDTLGEESGDNPEDILR